ncbi:MAG: hypothetical protein KF898_03240 [Parachlamydiales bacterium]|nr:hypothetical protein [Candidatus Acheromyda pituitae]
MAIQASSGATLDPNSAFNNYIQAWEQQQHQQALDLQNLAAAITTLKNMLNSGNVQGAFQFAGMVVMTQSMQCVGDNTGQFAGVENLGTGIRNIVGDLQSIFNEGGGVNSTDAGNFAKWINEFYNKMSGGCPSWMNSDSSDYSNIMNQLKGIYTEFGISTANMGKSGAGGLTGGVVSGKIKSWFKNPSGNAPNPAITAMQGDFQTLNNSVSAVSSSATASEQYWTNVYNQAQGVTNNIFQSIGNLNTNSVANEKTN